MTHTQVYHVTRAAQRRARRARICTRAGKHCELPFLSSRGKVHAIPEEFTLLLAAVEKVIAPAEPSETEDFKAGRDLEE